MRSWLARLTALVRRGGGARATAWRNRLFLVVCCYLTGLLVIQVSAGPHANWLHAVFPRFGSSASLDSNSLNAEWDRVRQEYFTRSVDAGSGTAGAERGIVDALKQQYGDRFSYLFTADEYSKDPFGLSGRRKGSIGIGVELRCGGELACTGTQQPTEAVLEQVLRNQPADRAGLRNGDVLVAVDGTRLSKLGKDLQAQVDKASPLIRGDPGSTVRLTVNRAGKVVDFTVTREDLKIPTVYSQRFASTLYLQVTSFGETTGGDAKSQLEQGLGAGATSVILDLRHNGGGYVSAAQRLTSQFVRRIAGKQEDVVVQRGRLAQNGDPASAENVIHDTLEDGGVAYAPSLAVLVDGASASASEIVSACIKDYHRGRLVGTKTFGKGSVQTDFTLPDGNDLHLTIAKWFGPAGESIDGQGVTPDQIVSLDSDDHRFRLDSQGPDAAVDLQLQAALSGLQH